MSYDDIMKVVSPNQGRQAAHITGHFGEQRLNGPHGGSDFNYEGGQAGVYLTHPTVHSPVTGMVTFVGGQFATVKTWDAEGNSHEILHTNSQTVTVGQHVVAEDAIAAMGGRGPHGTAQCAQHVHYQMKDSQGHPVNPETYWNDRAPTHTAEAATQASRSHDHARQSHYLQHGSEGARVQRLQEQLRELGSNDRQSRELRPVGHFGDRTRFALEAFQRAHGLDPDGVAGPKTVDAMRTAIRAPSTSAPSLDEPSHPGHGLYSEGLNKVAQLNAARGVAPSPRDANFAGALAVAAASRGLTHIDHVVLDESATNAFAVQGRLQGGIEGVDQKLARVNTMDARNTPLTESSAQWPQIAPQVDQPTPSLQLSQPQPSDAQAQAAPAR